MNEHDPALALLRHTGIEPVGDVPWGTHFCQFYETPQDLIEVLVAYFREGLLADEFCMWVCSEPLEVKDAEAALREAIADLDDRRQRGQIEILDYRDWYVRGGRFDADRVLAGWVEKLRDAERRGFAGLRLTGNTFWLEAEHWNDFTRYEEKVNSVISRYRMLALCTYSLKRCGAAEVMDVVANHQFALVKRAGRWQIVESAEHRKVEQALRESESKFRTVTDNTADFEFWLDPEGRYLYASPSCLELTGHRPEEFLADPELRFRIAHPDDRAALGRHREVEKNEPGRLEYRILLPDGTTRWVGHVCRPIFDEAGNSIGTRGSNRDITDRKEVEEKLQMTVEELTTINEELETTTEELRVQTDEIAASEAQLRSLYESMSEGIAQHEVVYAETRGRGDPGRDMTQLSPTGIVSQAGPQRKAVDYRIVDVNPAFEKITGIAREVAAGKLASELYGTGSPPFLDVYSRVAETGVPTSFDTEWAPMKKSFSISVFSPGRGRFVTVFTDVTERRRAERAVREGAARMKTILEATQESIWLFAPDGEILAANETAASRFGLKPADVIGRRFQELLAPELGQLRLARINEVIQSGRPLEFEDERAGMFFHHTFYPVPGEKGVAAVASFSRDITERRRAEERIRYQALLLENVHDAVYGLDDQFRVTSWNRAAERMFGWTANEAMGREIRSLLKSELSEADSRLARAQMLEGETVRIESWMTGKRGNRLLGDATTHRVADAGGEVGGSVVVVRDVTEARAAEERTRYLSSYPERNPNPIVELDTAGRVVYLNPAAESLFPGLRDAGARHPFLAGLLPFRPDSGRVSREVEVGGRWYHQMLPLAAGEDRGRVYALDISELKRNEARVAHLAKLYAMLSRVNETIVRTGDRQTLLDGVCRIVSEEGGFPLVWVGLLDGRRVIPAACCGEACGYLKDIRVETEGELGKGPTGTAIREDRSVVNTDFSDNPATAPWREPALRYGFRASASFPLHRAGRVVGAFTLYAPEPGSIDAEQVRLFEALSADVSYALDAMDQERLRTETEQALREAKEMLEIRVRERTAALVAEVEERRQAEKRLAAASEYARSLLEASLDPLVTINAAGRITDVNEATIKATGATRVELIGTDFSEYFTEPDDARAGYQRAFAEGSVTDYPLTIRHGDGHLTDVLYNASLFRDAQGNIRGVFAAARDVTARKQAEEELWKAHATLELKVAERTAELQRSNAELEQFAYVASHDLQQPLRMVASYVELLAQRYRGRLDEKADKYIEYAVGGARRMQVLIDALLRYSRANAHARPAQPVDLRTAADRARQNLALVLQEARGEIKVEKMPTVSGDETLLVQLFQNLFDNALKFRTKEPPRIVVRARRQNGMWEVAVADNGIGIDPRHQERIFKLFQRLHSDESYPGTGIGLAVCKKIVESHGGAIRVESHGGKGSTFLFTLPSSSPSDAGETGSRARRAGGPSPANPEAGR